MIDVFNNVLDDNNIEGWRVLHNVSVFIVPRNHDAFISSQKVGLTNESEKLLNNVEIYALVVASKENVSDSEQRKRQTKSRPNIGEFES